MIKIYTLYICILFALNLSAQNMNDTIIYKYKMYNDSIIDGSYYIDDLSPEDFIEKYKDSVIKDSLIIYIRKIKENCFGNHGGTFDWFDCYVEFGKLSRRHEYGADLRRSHYGDVQFNNDRYYQDGKLIRFIKADFLPSDPKNISELKIHIYDVHID